MKPKPSTPVRIDADLYAAATAVGPVMSRSAAQQVAHWARIGREVEASPEISLGDLARVLRGAMDYDALGAEEQAVVRTYWSERMAELLGALRLDREWETERRPYVELDERGRVVRRDPEREPEPRRSARG
jgi:hypothetical protein